MTRINGFTLVASPCCRALYKTPQYSSINLSAMGYWTDGQKEFGLMPSGGGQRKCKCGQFYLLREAIKLELDAEAETPHTVFVDAAGVHIKPSSSTLWQALARRAPQMEKGLLQVSIRQQVFQ